MLQPYVELCSKPQAVVVRPLPDGMALIELYDAAEQLEPYESGAERWRAMLYTMSVPNMPGLYDRIEAHRAAWLEKAKRATETAAATAIRKKRDELLRACDYTTGNDYPATDSEREAWRDYRQALRDVPEQPGFPWDVNWPSRPDREKADDTILATIDELLGGADT